MRILITGSNGLIGSEAVGFFQSLGFQTYGVDNNMRADLFGPMGDTSLTFLRLQKEYPQHRHYPLDIRDRDGIFDLFRSQAFDLIVHAAAQPSHDLAAKRPFDDFEINALGTLNLLEACRKHSPEAIFIYLSTNKVYGDGPNNIPMVESETRWDYADPTYRNGIPEDFPVDRHLHSLFGVSKLAGDLLAQEYGRYHEMKTGIFRGGCLTGPQHAGVELHGFLSYLARVAMAEGDYTIYGYKGKQVRDQIHSHDVIRALWEFAQDPRPGEVYNIGGGPENAASLIECVDLIEQASGKRPKLTYSDENRIGDHICYYSDLTKLRHHYPNWQIQRSLPQIVGELVQGLTEQVRS